MVLHRSVSETAAGLDADAGSYESLMGPLVRDWDEIADLVLGPPRLPRHPLSAARFARHGLVSASLLCRRFRGERARALLAGMAAHSMLPLNRPPTAAFALVLLGLGHSVGWPVARGGSQAITEAMAGYLRSLGGVIELEREVSSMADLPPADKVLFDVTPRQLLAIAGDELPSGYRAGLSRFRYGPGVFKLDYALSGPVPWLAEECRRATTVHLGGSFEQIAAAERIASGGGHSPRPVRAGRPAEPDRPDSRPRRAPHAVGVLPCPQRQRRGHERRGGGADRALRARLSRSGAGAARCAGRPRWRPRTPTTSAATSTAALGDLRQVLARPVPRISPYTTPNPRIFLCSSSTPPGGGVHGMCGYHAARAAL